jgi:hypothetical protein
VIAGYRIFLKLPDKVMNYHGIVLGDGVTPESRIDDELSGTHRINKRFAEALEQHGRYAFDWEVTKYFDSEYEAIEDEAARIERDKSWHPDYGFNVERKDMKRHKKAKAEFTPGASLKDQFDAALVDFKRNFADEWVPYDSLENETLLWEIATKDGCSVTTAFFQAREAGTLKMSANSDNA